MSDSSPTARKPSPGPHGASAAFSPLYRQIKALILKGLDQGEWKPGEAIPSEQDLAVRYQVSQGTVRKAIDELAADHLLLRRQGKGTFVATHNEARVRYRFLRLAPDDGVVRPSSSRLLGCRQHPADAQVAKALDVTVGDAVMNLQRVLSFDDVPTILDDIWLPGDIFGGLTLEALAQCRSPVYAFFESEFGVSMVRADERIRAVRATRAQGELLHVEPDSPLLQVERIAYTYGDRPMELRRGHYVTARYHYRNSLN